MRRWELVNRFVSSWTGGNIDLRLSLHFTRWGARRCHAWLVPFLAPRGGMFSIVLRDRRTGAEETLSVQ